MPWRLIRPDALRVREWDDAGVVYDIFNGNTHLLDPLGLELLDLLRLQPWTLSALADELHTVLSDDPDAGTTAVLLNAKLEQLERLGLATSAA